MRPTILLAVLALAAAACSPGSAGDDPLSDLPTGTLPEGPSALEAVTAPELPEPLVDPALIIDGGPPPDGIPPLDEPKMRSIEEAELSLAEEEAVITLEIAGDARAYPVEIMIWHEIVNDTVGGVPVAVTYCPLCNSAVTFRRTINGVETSFGTSGKLFASALVMYDRATESLWTHFDGRAVAGVLTGTELEPVPSPLLSWADFKAAHPDGQVLSRDTGFVRSYGRNPYWGYDNPETRPPRLRGEVDDRLAVKQRVVGIERQGEAVAFSLDAVSGGKARVTNTEVGGEPLVILWTAGQVSALEHVDTAKGRDVGSVGVFDPVVEGRTLTFRAEGDRFVDAETGSGWDVTGRALSGPLEGSQLQRIPHLDTFWFAWSTYRPDTTLVEG